MSKPLTPAEAVEQSPEIPDEIIDIVNDLIQENLHDGWARFRQDEILERLPSCFDVDEVFKNRWLDFESLYRQVGWKVTYESPGWNESDAATFTFVK
jgi:hypothetical protein